MHIFFVRRVQFLYSVVFNIPEKEECFRLLIAHSYTLGHIRTTLCTKDSFENATMHTPTKMLLQNWFACSIGGVLFLLLGGLVCHRIFEALLQILGYGCCEDLENLLQVPMQHDNICQLMATCTLLLASFFL